MRVSDQGLAEIISHEAIVLSPYLDSKNVLTIGVGHTAAAGEPNPARVTAPLTLAEAIELFRRDLVKYESEVSRALKRPVAQHQFDALVSFHFNTGGIARAALTRHINAGDMDAAAKAFMGWVKPEEIRGRRTKEMVLFRDGTYSHDGTARIVPVTASRRPNFAKGQRVSIASVLGAPAGSSKPRKPVPASTVAPRPAPPVQQAPEVRGGGFRDAATVRRVQQMLDDLGWHEVGTVDGIWGKRTEGAILAFRNEHEPQLLPLSPVIDQRLISALEVSPERRVSTARATATAETLARKGEPTILTAQNIQTAAIATGGFAGVGAVDQQGVIDRAKSALEGAGMIREIGEGLLDIVQWAAQKWWIVVIIAAALLVWKSRGVIAQRVADHRAGKNLAL